MALKFIVSAKDNDAFRAHVLEASASTLCVVDCHAGWCGPCDSLNKKIQNLYQDMIEFDLKFVQAQVDDIELLNANDKSSKPYFLFYKNGSEVAKVTGANAVEIEQHVQKHATKKPKE
mmetsp:Transcript_6983/g.11735  ORF Transcript_6983/g.11735 Transcript_6983/m.11735 type:complete len:118 (-) Transcript_6983:210-563(-)